MRTVHIMDESFTGQPPSVNLSTVVDVDVLSAHIANGYVRRVAHPVLPLALYNYTSSTQWDGAWDEVTTVCRGLVTQTRAGGIDLGSELVVARPFPKFFNVGERHAQVGAGDEPVVVTDKVDGSLGIVVPTSDGPLVTTRGSFSSEQAVHATQLLRDRYAHVSLRPDWTFLFEIVYPGNRIVVDYFDRDDLVLLGAVDIVSGRTVDLSTVARLWPGPVVDRFDCESFDAALRSPERAGAEGLVVHWPRSDVRVKVKYEQYKRRHAAVTDLSARRVWETLVECGSVDPLLELLPDELYGWVRRTAAQLMEQFEQIVAQVDGEVERVRVLVAEDGVAPDDATYRKALAQYVTKGQRPGLVFARIDGRDISAAVWSLVMPAHDVSAVDAASGQEAH